MSENRKINPKKVNIKPNDIKATLRQSQQKYVERVLNNDITFCQGPAGTSKTFTACYIALKLLAEKKIKTLVLCKPIQEAGEKLGFLPGDVQEKINPYMESYVSNMSKLIGVEATEKLVDAGIIQFKPLAFMRGDTYDDALMILDEAQNSQFKQLMLFVTRMGKNSKVIVTGDISQYDIAKKDIGLESFINLMEGIKGVGSHKFTEKDIVRAKILKDVVKRYEKWKLNNE
jgi:phosphate starvation-inducible PhoH-like protein